MAPPLPSPTPTWHNDTYPAISPSRPELSSAGKVIIITGGGTGIGRETALAFASAGAAKIVLLGRREAPLLETKNALPKSCDCLTYAVSVTDSIKMGEVAANIGTWDVLIMNAGSIGSPSSMADANIDEWWQLYETNVKGAVVTAKAFLSTANPTKAAIFGVGAGTITSPPSMFPGLSAYTSSKIAQAKVLEFIAAENPSMLVVNVHPGIVETDIFVQGGVSKSSVPIDTVQLPAHFMVWLAGPDTSFLNGKLVWVNWDVDELKAQAQSISSTPLFTTGNIGWPYSYSG